MGYQDILNAMSITAVRNGVKQIIDLLVANYTAADAVVTAARQEVGMIMNIEVEYAAIRAANTTPVVLIADPGADKYIVVEEVLLFHDYGGATYAFTGTASIQYGATEGGDDVITPYPDDNTILEATADAVDMSHGVDCVPVVGDGVNTGQIIYASAADSVTGTGTFKFSIKYRIVDCS